MNKKLLVGLAVGTMMFGLAQSASAFVFFGEDVNPTEGNYITGNVAHPNSDIARDYFFDYAIGEGHGVFTNGFEQYAKNTLLKENVAFSNVFGPTVYGSFSAEDPNFVGIKVSVPNPENLNPSGGNINGTHDLDFDENPLDNPDPNDPSNPAHPDYDPNAPATPIGHRLTLTFNLPQYGFGLYIGDVDYADSFSIAIKYVNGLTVEHTVPYLSGASGASTSGSIMYWGILDSENPFESISFLKKGPIWDGFGLDDLSVVGPSSSVPVPTTMLLFGSGIAGLFGSRRRKK